MDIKIPKNFFGEEIELTVFISEAQLQNKNDGKIYGKYFEDTGIFNIYPDELAMKGDLLGEILPEDSEPVKDGFCGIMTDKGIDFYWKAKKVNTESYSLYQNIFSRNKGILETDIMSKKWVLAIIAGAREIKRKDIKIRLIPLLEVVFEEAKLKVPSMVSSIHLKIIHDQSPNAFAMGRRTVCVTDGLLNLNDEEIMAVFAHELGHLAYHHSSIQLLIGGGNLFISGCLLLIKLICWMITAIFTLFAIGTRRIGSGLLITAIGSLSSISIWLWTKFCMLFLMWSMRQNEYVADEFAYKLGYGNILASVLDRQMCSAPDNGLLKALYSTHPHSDDRIARLQDLGATYSRY